MTMGGASYNIWSITVAIDAKERPGKLPAWSMFILISILHAQVLHAHVWLLTEAASYY